MLGMEPTAPVRANLLAARAQFIEDHPGWTFADYDTAAAGDIAFQNEYRKIVGACQRKALEEMQRDG